MSDPKTVANVTVCDGDWRPNFLWRDSNWSGNRTRDGGIGRAIILGFFVGLTPHERERQAGDSTDLGNK